MIEERLLRETRSVCPICLKNLPAKLVEREDGRVILKKICPEHGAFSATVWRGKTDFARWSAGGEALAPDEGLRCPAVAF